MIRALLLDLDDTLLDERASSAAGFEALWAAYPGPAGETADQALARWRALSSVQWKRFETGELTFQGQRRARVRRWLGTELADEAADRVWAVYQGAYEAAWRPVAGSLGFLDRTRRLPRLLVTNGERDYQRHKIAVTGLKLFEGRMVTPADAGAWKPDPAIFRFAFDRLAAEVQGLQPREVMMVGDDLLRDIEPARTLGFAVWHADPGRSPLDRFPDLG